MYLCAVQMVCYQTENAMHTGYCGVCAMYNFVQFSCVVCAQLIQHFQELLALQCKWMGKGN